MDLTLENKAYIDGLSIKELLRGIRFAPSGDRWFRGETGDYWMRRYVAVRDADPAAHTAASKELGWDG